jgi:hypothetical protein
MGFRFRKSVKIAPGVRLNVSSKSAGISVGGKGAKVSVSTSGRRTTSVGVPGTGVSYVSSKGGRKKKSKPVAASSVETPKTSRAGGIALVVVAALAFLIGLPTLAFGGWLFLLIGLPCLLLGLKMIKHSKKD